VGCVLDTPGPLPGDLTVEAAWCDDGAIARCRGRILYGVTARHLRTRVARLIVRHRHVVIDLSGVTHLDACGVGILAALVRLARGSHVGLVLAASSGRVRRLLQLTRLDTQVEFVTLENRLAGRTLAFSMGRRQPAKQQA
jgi:anti-sigma B factor antagonist